MRASLVFFSFSTVLLSANLGACKKRTNNETGVTPAANVQSTSSTADVRDCSPGDVLQASDDQGTPLRDPVTSDIVLRTLPVGEKVTCVSFPSKSPGDVPVVDSNGVAGVILPQNGWLGGSVDKVGKTSEPKANFPTEKAMDRFFKVGLKKDTLLPEIELLQKTSDDFRKKYPAEGSRSIRKIVRYVPESGKVSDLSTLNVAAAIWKNPVDVCYKDGSGKDYCIRSYHEKEKVSVDELVWNLTIANISNNDDAGKLDADTLRAISQNPLLLPLEQILAVTGDSTKFRWLHFRCACLFEINKTMSLPL